MQRLLRMPFAIKNRTRTPIWSGPSEDDEFNIEKSWIREPVRLPLPSSTSLNPKEAREKSILIFFALWALVARFPTNRRFFRQNGRISRIVLRGIYATNELNSTITTTEMRKLAKTKSLKLEQFFLAGFFAFIARPTLFYFIEKVMRSSLTLISKIVASSVAMHRRDLHFVGNTHIHCRGSLM